MPFDERSALASGKLKTCLEKGLTKSDTDLKIAAIVPRHRLTLVAGNTRHSGHITELKVESRLAE